MKFRDILKTKIKPELNNIYTEKPCIMPTGIDFGWFCREHALHLFVLGKLLGYEVNICTGDFLVNVPGEKFITSIGDNADHAWCCINNKSPIDISLCLRHIYPMLPDISVVFGTSNIDDSTFKILNFINEDDNKILDLSSSNSNLVVYNEKNRLEFNAIELLKNPYMFLLPPPIGSPKFTEIYCEDIFYKITYHCYKIATENIKPLFSYRDSKSSIKRISKFNPRAKKEIINILEKPASLVRYHTAEIKR